MTFDPSCIFCKIVKGQAPSSVVYENENVLAFLDIRPLNEGHTLIIPKKHYVDIFDIPEEQLAQIHKIAKHIAIAVKKGTNADGITVIQQNGKAAGQDIFHLHVHVVPRYEDQKLPRFSDLKMVERERLELVLEKIKQHINF